MNNFNATIIFPKDYSNEQCVRVTIDFDNPADILKAADEIRAREKKPGLVKGALVSNDATPMLWHQYQLAGPNHTCDASPPCRKLPPWDVMARTLACYEPEARWATCDDVTDGRTVCMLWLTKPKHTEHGWQGGTLVKHFFCARPEHPETCIIEIERAAR